MYYSPDTIIKKLEQQLNLDYYEICHFIVSSCVNLTDEEISLYLEMKYIEEMPEGMGKFNEEYKFDSKNVLYFKKYIYILKSKCINLIKIIDGIVDRKIPKEKLGKLDIILNERGNILMSDILRITEPFVFNFNKLVNMVDRANNIDTYLDFKLSFDNVYKNNLFASELYPRDDLQNSYFEFEGEEGYIPYTEKQKKYLRKKENEIVSSICDIYKNLK